VEGFILNHRHILLFKFVNKIMENRYYRFHIFINNLISPFKLRKPFISADVIKNRDFKEIEYVVDKLIPRGSLCALAGESDTGKSSLLRQLAFSLAYGDEDFIGFKLNGTCRNVLYLSTEDGEQATSLSS
jgi:RecA-family ATPase